MVFFAEAYLSALLRYGVYEPDGRYMGRLDDLLVDPHPKFPVVTHIAVKVKADGEVIYVPWADIRSASQEGMRLAPNYASATQPPENETSLRHEVLDRQIVDVSGQRVVRVHDVKLGAVGTHVLLTHADVGARGILRRLGWEHFTVGLLRTFHIHLGERLIAWEHVQSPTPGGELHIDHARNALKRMHPADLADIAEELSAPERAAFLGAMDEEVAADAMQEMEPEALVAAVEELSDEEAAGLVDEMDPDAGADLLADLPEERAEKILNLIEPEEAADLRKLLSYPEDVAGGLMTTDMVSVRGGLTVAEALEIVRQEAQEVDPVYYIHVVDKDGRLLGMLSLRELIIADPSAVVDDLMRHELVTVRLHTNQEDIARLVARYNMLAVPVVDEEGKLQGIVTADDAIDAVIPTSFKKRIPKVFAR